MAARPYQLHARKEIVTVETIDRPVTAFKDREAAEEEAELWRKAGFECEVIDTSKGEEPTIGDGTNPDAHHDEDAVAGEPSGDDDDGLGF